MQRAKKKKSKKEHTEEQTLEAHFQTKENLRRRRRRDLLGELLLASDTGSLILAHLSVEQLLLCSMTCRSLLKVVDASKNSAFNEHLRWWSNFHNPWKKDPPIVEHAQNGSAYKESFRLDHFDAQYLWLLNIVPVKGARVEMRMQLELGLDSVHLSGEAKDVERVRKTGHVSMDILEWEVLKVTRDATPQNMSLPRFRHVRSGVLGEVRMRVNTYLHLFKSVDVIVKSPVIITFRNVPIMDNPLSYRELFVIKCVYTCMHCHERTRRWLSVDASQPDHRTLCSVCIDHLYVEEKQLERKFKCCITARRPVFTVTRSGSSYTTECVPSRKLLLDPPTFSTLQNMRTHFVECMHGAPSRVISNWPKVTMLKSDVASFYGHASWTQFLACNYKNKGNTLNKSSCVARFRPSKSWW